MRDLITCTVSVAAVVYVWTEITQFYFSSVTTLYVLYVGLETLGRYGKEPMIFKLPPRTVYLRCS